MRFSEFATYLDRLEKTPSRIEITKILADLFNRADVNEIDKICYLSLGILAPSYQSIVFNLAEQMMLAAIARAYGCDINEVKRLNKIKGDLGEVAESYGLKTQNKKQKLSVVEIYERLVELAKDEGEKSVERKVGKMADLLASVNPLSARYLARIPVGKLRLGFSDKTVLDALSWMETGGKSKSKQLESAYVILPDVGLLTKTVKENGIDRACRNVSPIVGVPVLPMLASRIKSTIEMIEKMGEVSVEPKFDGLRVLIHFSKAKVTPKDVRNGWVNGVKAFTRNLNNVVLMFTELAGIGKYLKADEIILDTEAVGMDPEMKRLVDFQTTMKRRRKHDIEASAKSIPIRFQVFDIIYKNGKSFMDIPYTQRRFELAKTVVKNSTFVVDDNIVTTDPEVINREYREKIKMGLEGVIVKKTSAAYVPGRTGWRWVKMKMEEASTGKLTDTIDCVVMGYTLGRGKRATFGLGQFLVGVKDRDNFTTLTKVGTGLSDDEFKAFSVRLTKYKQSDMPKSYQVHKNYTPDYWVPPRFVVELSGDDLTISPTHTSGYALRFPRLVKFRDDKDPGQATTVVEVKKLYELQK